MPFTADACHHHHNEYEIDLSHAKYLSFVKFGCKITKKYWIIKILTKNILMQSKFPSLFQHFLFPFSCRKKILTAL